MSISKAKPEDIRAVEGIHLIRKAFENLSEMKTKIERLGIGYIRNKIHDDIDYLRAIMYTAGNPIASNKLVEKINLLDGEVNDEFPYAPKVKEHLLDVSDAFRIALARHIQEYEGRNLEAIIKSLGSTEVLDRPKSYFSRFRSKSESRSID